MRIRSWMLGIMASGWAVLGFGAPNIQVNLLTQTGPTRMFTTVFVPKVHNGQLMFAAKTLYGQGDYVYSQGKIYVIATSNTPMPEGMGYFRHFSPQGFSLLRSSAVFVASGTGWQKGIYLWQADKLTTVADTDISFPGQPQDNLVDFLFPKLTSDRQVSFIGKTFLHRTLVFTWHDGKLTQPFALTGVKKVLGFDATPDQLAVITVRPDDQAIEVFNGHAVATAVDRNTQLPGKSVGYFTHFESVSLDASSNDLAFIGGGILGQKGVYVLQKGQLIFVADKDTMIPQGLGSFSEFSAVSFDQGNVIFYGVGNMQQAGIFLFNVASQTLFKILTIQDKINGQTLKSITLGPQALSGNHIACLLQFQDDTEAIADISF